MELTKETYKPVYVWPNPAFPFRIYYESDKGRIFIIENIRNNWDWFKEWHEHFKPTDFFLVYSGWYFSKATAKDSNDIFKILGLSKDNFLFLFNSKLEMQNHQEFGFWGDVINQNAWLDENIVMRPMDLTKLFDAIYVARRSGFKRHELACKVKNLALVAGRNHGNVEVQLPPHTFINDKQLTPDEVCVKINESHCGLILSETEGACFASSEYLLCGVPVVSTASFGGRDEWYNEYNSQVVGPDPDSIAKAVEFFKSNPRDPQKIRQMHIEQSNAYRTLFIQYLQQIFDIIGEKSILAEDYFRKSFFHKLRKSYVPDFKKIFGNK